MKLPPYPTPVKKSAFKSRWALWTPGWTDVKSCDNGLPGSWAWTQLFRDEPPQKRRIFRISLHWQAGTPFQLGMVQASLEKLSRYKHPPFHSALYPRTQFLLCSRSTLRSFLPLCNGLLKVFVNGLSTPRSAQAPASRVSATCIVPDPVRGNWTCHLSLTVPFWISHRQSYRLCTQRQHHTFLYKRVALECSSTKDIRKPRNPKADTLCCFVL